MLGECSAPEQLVDTVNGQEARDVGTKVVGDCDSDRVGCDHLHEHRKCHVKQQERRRNAVLLWTSTENLKFVKCKSNHPFHTLSAQQISQLELLLFLSRFAFLGCYTRHKYASLSFTILIS